VAYEEAIKYGGKVILGDRPVQVIMICLSVVSKQSFNNVMHFMSVYSFKSVPQSSVYSLILYFSKQITLKRTWAKMPLWHKVKFLYSILFQAVFLPGAEELEKMVSLTVLFFFLFRTSNN